MATSGARVHIYGDWDGTGVKKATQDISFFEKQATGFSGNLTKSFTGMGAALGGAFAIGSIATGVLDFLQSSMQAAIADEKSMVSLAKAMDNVGLSAQKSSVEEFIKKLSLATGVADDELRPAMQRLVTATGDAAKSQKLLSLALDISVATGKDATSVATALGKAANGQFSALTRLGVPLEANVVKTKNFSAVVDVLSKKFGGQAAAAADTYGGKLQRIQVAADEAKETIGYALMGALDGISKAFGNTGDMVGLISKLGDATADVVTGMGIWAARIAELIPLLDQGREKTDLWGQHGENFVVSIAKLDPMLIGLAATIGFFGSEAQNAAAETEKNTAALNAWGAAYGAVAAAEADRAPKAAAAAEAEARLADQLSKAEQAAIKARDSIVHATDALKAWQQALSQSGSMDKWKADLIELRSKFDGVNKSLSDNTLAGLKNRDAIRGYASDLITAVEDWGNRYDKTVTQRIERQAGEAAKLRQSLIDSGFKAADVDKFLGGVGLWNKQMQLISSGLTRGQAASAMRYAGMAVGKALTDGVTIGISQGTPTVTAQAASTVDAASYAARKAAQIQSPSKVWAEIGTNLMDGLKAGMVVGWPQLAAQITTGMEGLTITMRGESAKLTKETADAFAKQRDIFNDIVDAQASKIIEAKQALQDYAKSVADTVMGNIDMSSTNPDGTAMTPEQWVNALFGGIEGQSNLVTAVAQLTGKIPEAVQQQLLTMAPEQGIAFANFLADPKNSALLETLTWNYEHLATYTQNALGIPMATAFATVGGESATGMIAAAKKTIAAAAEDFQKWVSRHLSTDITVRVHYASDDLPGRATGGPVSAGSAFLVGERGPEVFVPNVNGTIVPNNALGGSGAGSTYSISVQAGVGDPAAIGRTVVESIRAYERRSGKVFASA